VYNAVKYCQKLEAKKTSKNWDYLFSFFLL
jgi:hypothetical protein